MGAFPPSPEGAPKGETQAHIGRPVRSEITASATSSAESSSRLVDFHYIAHIVPLKSLPLPPVSLFNILKAPRFTR